MSNVWMKIDDVEGEYVRNDVPHLQMSDKGVACIDPYAPDTLALFGDYNGDGTVDAADAFEFLAKADPEEVALLLPAIQSAREAARSADPEPFVPVPDTVGLTITVQPFQDILSDM